MRVWLEARLRCELVAAGAVLARRGLVRAREGNLSCRVDGNRVLLTPRGADKGMLAAADLICCGLDGELPAGASSESLMHLETYRSCPDVRALVHAHPAGVLGLEARGGLPDPAGLKEGEALVGKVARVPVYPPGSLQLAQACARALRRSPVAVMARHGVVAAGDDVWEALARVEAIELLAQVALARRLGGYLT